jgi:hypothetical protein
MFIIMLKETDYSLGLNAEVYLPYLPLKPTAGLVEAAAQTLHKAVYVTV